MNRKTYIMLGRTGDVINILPVIENEHQRNKYKPRLVVAKRYADVLDGCSYVDKVIYPGNFKETHQAVEFTQRKFPEDEIINCAVYGEGYHIQKLCTSFLREAWRLGKARKPWGHLPLTFDKRDRQREKRFLDSIGYKENFTQLIVASLNGTSSPFPDKEKFLQRIVSEITFGKLQKYQFVDISDIQAERIYDLLGLYEKAKIIITTDSAPLHLTHATPDIPVIALVTDKPDEWHQSSWRPNQVLRIPYPKVVSKLDEIIETIINPVDKRKIFFVSSSKFNADSETKRRNEFAAKTRELEIKYSERVFECFSYQNYERKSDEGMPYVKDMINFISDKAGNDDILMICNFDICFMPGIVGQIIDAVNEAGAGFFHRWDMRTGKIDEPLISESQLNEKGYIWYDGSDTFVFTKEWWLNHRDIFPDMIFGREWWDNVFRNMIKRAGGKEIHKGIYHLKHPGFWEINKKQNLGNRYNTRLALKWFAKYGGGATDWKIKPENWKYTYR